MNAITTCTNCGVDIFECVCDKPTVSVAAPSGKEAVSRSRSSSGYANGEKLRAEIAAAINRCSAENGSDTPDFILANFLTSCLEAFDAATVVRQNWYGYTLSIPYKGPQRADTRDSHTEEVCDGAN